ncbi:uncharacterized protein LOC142886745 isoform X3 [Nelusetta ayraudi]|uniref:uncharacterized protein LOC142886745 isoform X3 n=1 Tax=Nelusetta ayraudi TaxID=303726 RepID=UPI003F720FF7
MRVFVCLFVLRIFEITEYKDDEGPIPKGSSVIVRRIPIIGARSGSTSKTRNNEQLGFQSRHHNFGSANAMDDRSSSRALHLFSKMTNLAAENLSEEDKIKAVLYQSSYSTMSYSTKSTTSLPANYTCYRCGNAGHHIRNCPTSDKNAEPALRLKKSTGIPRSFMVEVDDPSIKGAMLTNCGSYAIPAIHANAYAVGKKEKPPFAPQEAPVVVQDEPIPNELLCLICHELLSDAVVIPCCGNSFCDDCIRTALLDSEQHSCPSCSQSDVSPDSLIANKFLRKAVNTFQKEQGQKDRGCGSSQSQNPALAPSPVPAPPPLSTPSQPQKPDSLQAEAPPPSSPRSSGAPPTATSHAPSASEPSVSSHPAQSNPEGPEAENAAEDPAAPPEPVSLPGGAPAAPQADEAAAGEQLQTVSGGAPQQQQEQQQQSSSDPAPGRSETYETFAPKDATSSSSFPAAPPPLFPSPHFHPFLPAQQHLPSYPPGYPPALPIWMLQNPPGSEWYVQQRPRSERSPHRDSAYRRSPSHSKSKSSRSYSRSSSRSRSRSRSLSRSRRRSPYSRHSGLHARSQSSYTYGYKRSPTPSSSSSPQLAYRSRSKSPSDHRKKSHHHGKRSASSRHSSRRRGQSPRREAGGSENPHGPPEERDGGFDPEQQRYLQWEREYKEWCEKYLSSYVSHFHQPPPAPFHLNPASLAAWQGKGSSQHVNREHRRAAQQEQDDLSPPSRSSSDSYSTPSRSASDSRSSPSPVPSPPRRSQSSNDGPSTPKELKRSRAGTHRPPPAALTEGSDDSEPQEGRGKEKQPVGKIEENASASKHRRRRPRRDDQDPEAAGLVDDDGKDRRSCGSGGDGSPQQQAAKSDKGREIKRSRRRDSTKDEFADRGRHSADSRHDGQGQDKRRPSKERVGSDKEKYGQPRGKNASDWRSERAQKRKGRENVSSLLQNTDKSDEAQTHKSESQDQSDKKKERQTRPMADSHIWEGGMKVKAQKKISINISLDARRKPEKADDNDPVYLEGATGKTVEEGLSVGDGMESEKEKYEMEEDANRDEREPVGIRDVTSSGDRQEQTEEETSGGKAAEEDSWLPTPGGAGEEPEAEEERRGESQVLKAGGKEKWRSIEDGSAEVLAAAATSEEDEARKSFHGGPHVSMGNVSSAEDHEEQQAVANTGAQATASQGEDKPADRQIFSPKWDLEETEESKQDINVQTDARAVSHPSQSAWVTVSTTTEKEKGQDMRGITERESNAATSCSVEGLAPSGGKDGADSPPSNRRDPAKETRKGARQEQKESRRWKEDRRRTGREGRRSPPPWSQRANREITREAMTSDSRVRDRHSPHRRQTSERRAGSRRRSPSRSKERRRRASSPPQESSGRAGDRSAREGRKTKRPDEVTAAAEEGKWPRDELEGGRWAAAAAAASMDGRWELEEGERPGSSGSKSSSSSMGGRESCSGRRRHRAEKRQASPEPLDDWRPRKHKHRE